MSFVFITDEFAEELKKSISNYARALLRIEAEKRMLLGPFSVVFTRGKTADAHDYYSEAPYWWPDGGDENNPYIRRDGQVNTNRFTAHECAMFTMCESTLLLSQAGFLLDEPRFTSRAAEWINIWFIAPATAMNPNLRHAQAIHGVCEGRFIGIIDSTALINVIHAAGFLEKCGCDMSSLRAWFAKYLHWLLTDEESLKERMYVNNHALWYSAQSMAFAAFCGETKTLHTLANEFMMRLLPEQMAPDGSFPHEMARTRSYMYSNFALEACTIAAQVQQIAGKDDLWHFTLPDGRCILRGAEYMAPFIQNPFSWAGEELHTEAFGDRIAVQLAALVHNRPDLQAMNESARINTPLFGQPSHIGAASLLPGYGSV